MSKKSESKFVVPEEKLLTPRFIVALLLVLAGIAWLAYYYFGVRLDPSAAPGEKAGGPKFLSDLGLWNYTIGFALLMIGLVVAAHKQTPLGRGRGVVVGMLGCFLIGLLWIAVYYMFATPENTGPGLIEDLGNYNLLVGISFMAVGFAYATKWE